MIKFTGHPKKYIPTSANNLHDAAPVLEAHRSEKSTCERSEEVSLCAVGWGVRRQQ